jgi:EmrB/QacA subfamily drug resistance transporter
VPAQPSVPQTRAAAHPQRWIVLVVLLIASFMNLLDVTIVNVAMPSMEAGLGSNPSDIEWVVAGYVLAFALGLLPFGRLGDIIGRKQLFLVGAGLFTLASAACGSAPSTGWLIAARVLEGIGGGIMTPQVLAIVQVIFPPQERGLAFSLFAFCNALASVTGPIIGGFLISANLFDLDWRPIFLANVPFGLLAVIAGNFLIPATSGDRRTLGNDYVGIALSIGAILALIFPLVEGQSLGWPLWLFAMMAVGGALLAVFYAWERSRAKAGKPQLLSVGLLHEPNFLLGAMMTMVFYSAVPGLFLVLALFLQGGFGFTPLHSGLTTVPWPIGVAIASGFGAWLGSRFLLPRLIVGIALMAMGMIVFRVVLTETVNTVNEWYFAPPLLIAGCGLGVLVSSLFQTTLSTVPADEAGAGSGALQAFQQVGGALGVALLGEIFFATLAADLSLGTPPHAAYVAAAGDALFYAIGAFLLLALMVPFIRMPRGAETGAPRIPKDVSLVSAGGP